MNPKASAELNEKVKKEQLGDEKDVKVFTSYQAFTKKMTLFPDFYAI